MARVTPSLLILKLKQLSRRVKIILSLTETGYIFWLKQEDPKSGDLTIKPITKKCALISFALKYH